MFRFTPTEIPEVVLVEPRVFQDARGFFLETWHAGKFAESGIDARFVQDNHSLSGRGTLRGLHAQVRRAQGKLLRAVEGEVFDVAVDIRRGSPTFARHAWARLSAENFRQLWIPPGFAHGFYVLSERAQVEYKCTEFYAPDDEIGVAWNDPEIAITWPDTSPRLSDKDARAPKLRELWDRLPVYGESES